MSLKFNINFECKCGNKDTSKNIIRKNNDKSIYVLCGICERKYEIEILSSEIKLENRTWQNH